MSYYLITKRICCFVFFIIIFNMFGASLFLFPFHGFIYPFFCCRSNGIVYKEQMSAWATAHTQVFSLFVKKKKNKKQTGHFYLFHFLCTRHGMEEEAGSKGSSSHKRCNNFRWPTRKTRKKKNLRYLFRLLIILFSIDSITSYAVRESLSLSRKEPEFKVDYLVCRPIFPPMAPCLAGCLFLVFLLSECLVGHI